MSADGNPEWGIEPELAFTGELRLSSPLHAAGVTGEVSRCTFVPVPPSFELGVTIQCGKCGLARDVELPMEAETPHPRVLRTDTALHIETAEPCQCGSRHVVSKVNFGATG